MMCECVNVGATECVSGASVSAYVSVCARVSAYVSVSATICECECNKHTSNNNKKATATTATRCCYVANAGALKWS